MTTATKPKTAPKKVVSKVERASWNAALILSADPKKHVSSPHRLYAYSKMASYARDENGEIIPFNYTGVRSLTAIMIESLLAKLDIKQVLSISQYVYTRNYLTDRKMLNVLNNIEHPDQMSLTSQALVSMQRLQAELDLNTNKSIMLLSQWGKIRSETPAIEYPAQPPEDFSNGRDRVPVFISTSWVEHPDFAQNIQLWREIGLMTPIVLAFLDEIALHKNGVDDILANTDAFVDQFVAKITAPSQE